MRIAMLQGPAATDLDGSLAEVGEAARSASLADAAMLVCAELTCTGYRLPLVAEPMPDDGHRGRIGATMRNHAREFGIAIAYGYAEAREPLPGGGSAVHNSVAVVDPDGRILAHYRKTHLYRPPASRRRSGVPDDSPFTPGDVLVEQFVFDGLTIGVLICYDVEFPEAVRAHAIAGADCLLVPTALAESDSLVATSLVPARAVESQLFIAYVNRAGCDDRASGGPDARYCGLTCAIAPDGTELSRAGSKPELLFADVDPGVLAASRRRNTYLRDLRPDLYAQSPMHRRTETS
ncbi:nitrilase-related carbon-nitrogen hydrolase [Gordonia neofelifaecis]|uniref:Nitrilase n=1 Tax=Gordonia neofelifaecis NRRL B-59395 TaxID=644548 RepID=F1YGW7_9ACTN|nr:nitrilase-related carbon-nitrogen hydrolase [Gordonia neofelifaecis]EGD56265.1 nitrilase [Gordonia neofelifaecis NRRL B-59395]